MLFLFQMAYPRRAPHGDYQRARRTRASGGDAAAGADTARGSGGLIRAKRVQNPSHAAATRLDSWLRSEAQANGTDRVPTKRIYQYGPNCVRDSRDLRAALAILAERGRAWLEESGRRRSVVINPALLTARE